MEEIASAVESDLGDTRGEGALGDRLADDGGGVDAVLTLGLGGEGLVVGRGGNQGLALEVVDDLDIDLLVVLLLLSILLSAISLSSYYLAEAVLPALRRRVSPANLIPLPL